jgi:hypothetical protein
MPHNPFTIAVISLFLLSCLLEAFKANYALSAFMLLSALINFVVPLINR